MINTVRGRLTLWYVAALALALAAFGATFYFLASRDLYTRVDNDLRSLVEIANISLIHDTEEGQSSSSSAFATTDELKTLELSLLIFDASGKLLAKNHPEDMFQTRLPDLSSIPENGVYLYTVVDEDGARHRLATRRVTIPPTNIPYIILVGQSLKAIDNELELLRRPLLFAGLAALLLAGVGGWMLARKSLAPVIAMAERARKIGAENLGEQLPVANPRDELGQLGATFNELLSRLHTAFEQQRRFMADASHELRTPLSVMSAAAGVILRKPRRKEGEYRETIQMMSEQTQRLSRIVKDMFTLARADAGRYPLDKRALYLNDLLEEVARAARLLAAEKDVALEITNDAEAGFHGDEDLLRQMILNLVDNAIKHTPPGGAVSLRLTQEPRDYVISVSDTGSGIPHEAQGRIFERFYRADKARSHSEDGNGVGAGLGLAIASWIAQAHAGSLELTRSDLNGATFTVRLPSI
jgi:heavy metal sensor kinase